MTEPERAALDHIRQVVDSVLGVPAPPEPLNSEFIPPEPAPPEPIPPEPPAPLTSASILPVPYISQLGNGVDQFTNDSGAVAGVMLARAFIDQSITPSDFYKQTGQSPDNPLSFSQILNAMGVNGVPVELRSNLKLTDLALILFSGRPVIVPVRQSILQEAGLTPEKFDGPFYVVVVGLDVKQVYIHDPLRKDTSGQAQGIPWITFYQAWTQAQGYERAVLVPHQQLVRRVWVTAEFINVHEQSDENSIIVGTVSLGELFEITTQRNGWGKIGEGRWISLSNTADI